MRDRATKEPFDPGDPGLGLFVEIKREAFAAGLMCYPGGGTADGVAGDHILLAPPFIIEPGHVDEIVAKLGAAIDVALEKVASKAPA